MACFLVCRHMYLLMKASTLLTQQHRASDMRKRTPSCISITFNILWMLHLLKDWPMILCFFLLCYFLTALIVPCFASMSLWNFLIGLIVESHATFLVVYTEVQLFFLNHCSHSRQLVFSLSPNSLFSSSQSSSSTPPSSPYPLLCEILLLFTLTLWLFIFINELIIW